MSDITVNNFKAFYEQIRPYLGAAHSGFTPIGTVISVMGTTAPLNYLACDGTIYNISDYTELAAYFNQQFGSSNFFGGDGTNTFAVPDLRGEFLRGTGTNSHANQGSGAAVGVHQDATEHLGINASHDNQFYMNGGAGISQFTTNSDSTIVNTNKTGRTINATALTWTGNGITHITSRPTNTSVLYCIASKNIFMDAGSNYSTEEQVVGTWIDSKPIYQKTWTGLTSPQSGQTSNLIEVSSFMDTLVNISGNIFEGIPVNVRTESGGDQYFVFTRREGNYIKMTIGGWSNAPVTLTLQYTKTTDA